MDLSKQTVGNVGLYFVCYRLSREGWNVMPTSRNARGIDIVVYSDDGCDKYTFQVKALSKRNPASLGSDLAHFTADFLVVCRYVQRFDEWPECFVLTRDDVKRLCKKWGKGAKTSYTVEAPQYESEKFREKFPICKR